MPVLNCNEILEREREAVRLLANCTLCPRSCGVDRTSGETGYCDTGPQPAVAAILPHFGEEPPVTGDGGAGTIFFSGCNMRCVYCQNYQISQEKTGHTVSSNHLTREILRLQEQGCSNVELVSPSHHLPGVLHALAHAVERGLSIPVVYNTNGYEALETLNLLDGIVDVYLPDLKYASATKAFQYSATPDYVETARAAILKMHSQVGNLVVDVRSRAVRGLILRHLVLPGDIAETYETLAWIRDHLPRTITLSIMAQYTPLYRSSAFPPLDRALTAEEYDGAIDYAWSLGFENVFIQHMNSRETGVPDFTLDQPFNWE